MGIRTTRMKSLAEELAAKMVLSDRPTPKQGIKPNAWTPEHDAIMRERYAHEGGQALTTVLGRTRRAIQCHADKLGLKFISTWTPEHDAVLREHYLSGGSARVAELLGRTANSVQCRAAKIGVKGDPLRSVKSITQRKRSTEWRQAKAAKWQPPQPKAHVEPIITSDTKVTLCPHGVDMRYRVTSAPRVIDSAECRPWAALV